MSLVRVGELSSARQALEGASLAPGTLATLGIFPNRRLRVPRVPLSEEVQHAAPARLFELDAVEFLTNLRKARRGAAPGPSGMTSDHLFPVLESLAVSELLVQVASHLAVGRVPEEIIEVIRLGRLTALSKPDGGVRGIVVATFSEGWLPEPWPGKFARRWKSLPLPSSTPFPPRQVVGAWHTSSRR